LDIVDETLVYLDKESYLPNKLGTKGFIDILAKDNKGHLVIIEVKKSNSVARAALHEVLKYLEGIKQKKKLRDDEIRIIIVSTKWDELLVPFSSFYKRCNCNIEGFLLAINKLAEPVSVKRIKPLKLENDRLFSDQHMLRFYTSEENMIKGISSHEQCYKKKGINNYVLVVLSAPEGCREKTIGAIENNLKQFNEEIGGSEESQDDVIKKIKEDFPDYRYLIYSATLLLGEKSYWDIIKQDKNIFEEINEIISDCEDEERISTLYEYAVDVCEPVPYYETLQIGYPAKFQEITENSGWVITKIIRGGSLEENEILSDEVIIGEIKGNTGSTQQKYSREFSSENKADLITIKKEVKNCLKDNLEWQIPMVNIIEQLQELAEQENFTGKTYIYNPMHTIYTIYLMVSKGESLSWVPTFYISVNKDEETLVYIGCLKGNGKKPSLSSALKEFYDERLFDFFFSLTWGGYQENDNDIATSLGLTYTTFLIKQKNEGKEFYEYINFRFVECKEFNPLEFLFEFLNKEEKLVEDIIYLFENQSKELGYTLI